MLKSLFEEFQNASQLKANERRRIRKSGSPVPVSVLLPSTDIAVGLGYKDVSYSWEMADYKIIMDYNAFAFETEFELKQVCIQAKIFHHVLHVLI